MLQRLEYEADIPHFRRDRVQLRVARCLPEIALLCLGAVAERGSRVAIDCARVVVRERLKEAAFSLELIGQSGRLEGGAVATTQQQHVYRTEFQAKVIGS